MKQFILLLTLITCSISVTAQEKTEGQEKTEAQAEAQTAAQDDRSYLNGRYLIEDINKDLEKMKAPENETSAEKEEKKEQEEKQAKKESSEFREETNKMMDQIKTINTCNPDAQSAPHRRRAVHLHTRSKKTNPKTQSEKSTSSTTDNQKSKGTR